MAAAAREPIQHQVGGPIRKKGIGAILAPLGGLARRAWGSVRSVRPPSPSTVLAAFLAAVLLRIVWQSLPKWVKRTVTGGGRRRGLGAAGDDASASSMSDVDAVDDRDDDDDVLAPDVIARKLQGVLDLASEKLERASTLRGFELYASLLALLQLTDQFEVRVGEVRDDLYSRSGEAIGADEVPKNMVDRLRMTDWAYLEETSELRSKLKGLNLTMVRHVKVDEPGRVGHYIAIDPEQKLAYIVAKGTSDLSDMVTDACGVPARHELSRSPFGPDYECDGGGEGNVTLSCHEGILEASRSLADDVQPLVEHLFLPSGFRLILMGHSLGAGVACMVGAFLRSRLPELMRDDSGGGGDNDGGGTLRVLAFAPPPVLNYRAAGACSPFVTSVVNNLDVIPRASLSNVVVLLDLLRVVNDRLEERGLSPRDVTSTVALLRKLSEWEEGDMIMTPDEVLDGFEEARGKIDTNDPDHLFVPGRVLVLYEKSKARVIRDGDNVTDIAAPGADMFRAIVSDGAAAVLQYIAIDGRMIEDHMPVAYEKTLRGLRMQSASHRGRNSVKEVVA